MRQPKLNLKKFLLPFLLTAMIAAMIFNAPPQNVQAQDIATPTPEVEVQIVGGAPATPGEWPWQVALVFGGAVDLYNGQFCGGSLINSQWVLTAAHCVTESDGSVSLVTDLDVVAGIHNLATGTGYQRRDVYQIIRHPLYNDATLENDIALIQLSSSIVFGGSGATTTAAVALAPASSGTFVGASSWVTGWGKIATTPDAWDDDLNEVNIPIISNSTCSIVWGGIDQDNICAGIADGKDSCSGDSGGPLVVNVSGTWTLVGIVSSGTSVCGDAPGIYTRVSQYTNWINPIIPTHYVSNITRQNTNPSNATSVSFLVTFNTPVTGVDVTDFSLTTSGAVTGESITGVSGSGASYVVTVGTGSGNGTIRLDVVDNDSILNSYSSPLGGTDTGNGNFTSGEVYTISVVSNLQAPALRSPATKTVLNATEPSFQWTKVVGAKNYQIEFSTDSGFGSLHANSTTGITVTSLMVGSAFADGEYFWRVRANNSSDQPGKWSVVRSFTIDTAAPAEPILVSPNASSTTRHVVTFIWDPSPSAVLYQFVYDNDPDCSSPIYSKTTNKTSIRPPAIPNGTYYWCVGAKDAAGNWSGLQITPFTFTIAP